MADADDAFDRLTDREQSLDELTRRGRRRGLRIMVLSFGWMPFAIYFVFRRLDLPVGPSTFISPLIGMVVGVAYYRRSARRDPSAMESYAFLGLSRRRRWDAYRAMWRGERVDDPMLRTLPESSHHGLRRNLPVVVGSFAILAILGPGMLLAIGPNPFPTWVVVAMFPLFAFVIAQQLWWIKRSAKVLALDDAA